jgi:hypothetical protein
MMPFIFAVKCKTETAQKKLAFRLEKEQMSAVTRKRSSMKIRPANLFWIIFLAVVAGGFVYALIPPRPDTRGQKLFAETRQLLRQQGFKTDLSDFDFSTTPEMRSLENILKATATERSGGPVPELQNLMEIASTHSAIVVWKQATLKSMYRSRPDEGDELTWDDFRATLAENQSAVDAACETILSNPIAFNLDAGRGSAMLLPHLALLKRLTLTLGSRMTLALHDGDESAAFTNLLAATRLVTAWKIEPAEISQLVRFADVKLVFAATWQALQTNNWPDDQLARLQAEWESVNFFTNQPEIVAFQRASRIAAYDYDRYEILHPSLPFDEFLRETWPNPLDAWHQFQSQWRQRAYLHGGKYDEEKDVLLFYRDREIERRNAVQATTWMQMRQLPGVTNEIPFQSRYGSRVQVMENMHRIGMTFQRQGFSFLGRAAEAEAECRILITAIALERYRGNHGSYPNSLAQLTPEFQKAPLPDFMDGQPLRYRLTDDGHFLLYSIGLDCVDNAGKILERSERMAELREFHSTGIAPEEDIVWPLPASMDDVTALRQKEIHTKELQNQRDLEQASNYEWSQAPIRQARVAAILATNWLSNEINLKYDGQPVSKTIRNVGVTGTNRLSLAELLTPRRVGGADEPEVITFELPVSYDVVTNIGSLTLLADADLETSAMADSGATITLPSRAANGDCLLAWHAIFDPPGPHAVQVQLFWADKQGGEFWVKGPAIPVTTSNLCQFSLSSANFDPEAGAIFHARLPETNSLYTIECVTTNGEPLATLTGSTTNGEIKAHWNLIDDHGRRFTGNYFNSVVHLTFPDSGRTQTLRGP